MSRREKTTIIPEGFIKKTIGNDTLYLKGEYEGALLSSGILTREIDSITGDSAQSMAGGRGTVYRMTISEIGDVVVRKYRRGGLLRNILKDKFIIPGRGRRELVALTVARREGVSVPEPIGAVETRNFLFYRARIVTRELTDCLNLPDFLDKTGVNPDDREGGLIETGKTIRSMHDAGIYHRDLNMNNLMITTNGKTCHVIDFDRAKIYSDVGMRRIKQNLRRLLRSARKLKRKTGLQFADGDFEALLTGYSGREGREDRLYDELISATLKSRLLVLRSRLSWVIDRLFFGRG